MVSTSPIRRRRPAIAVATGVALALTACTGRDAEPPQPTADSALLHVEDMAFEPAETRESASAPLVAQHCQFTLISGTDRGGWDYESVAFVDENGETVVSEVRSADVPADAERLRVYFTRFDEGWTNCPEHARDAADPDRDSGFSDPLGVLEPLDIDGPGFGFVRYDADENVDAAQGWALSEGGAVVTVTAVATEEADAIEADLGDLLSAAVERADAAIVS